jgi:CheY-like chemotaxis protein
MFIHCEYRSQPSCPITSDRLRRALDRLRRELDRLRRALTLASFQERGDFFLTPQISNPNINLGLTNLKKRDNFDKRIFSVPSVRQLSREGRSIPSLIVERFFLKCVLPLSMKSKGGIMPEVHSTHLKNRSTGFPGGSFSKRRGDENKKILVIDEEGDASPILKFILQQDGYRVTNCDDPADAIAKAGGEKFNLAIVIPSNRDTSGTTLLTRIKQCDDKIPVVILSSLDNKDSYSKAINLGARDYLQKPIDYIEIKKIIEYS